MLIPAFSKYHAPEPPTYFEGISMTTYMASAGGPFFQLQGARMVQTQEFRQQMTMSLRAVQATYLIWVFCMLAPVFALDKHTDGVVWFKALLVYFVYWPLVIVARFLTAFVLGPAFGGSKQENRPPLTERLRIVFNCFASKDFKNREASSSTAGDATLDCGTNPENAEEPSAPEPEKVLESDEVLERNMISLASDHNDITLQFPSNEQSLTQRYPISL